MAIKLSKSYNQLINIFTYLNEMNPDVLCDFNLLNRQIEKDTTLNNGWYQVKNDIFNQLAMGSELIDCCKDIIKNHQPKINLKNLETQIKNYQNKLGYDPIFDLKSIQPCTNQQVYNIVVYNIETYHHN